MSKLRFNLENRDFIKQIQTGLVTEIRDIEAFDWNMDTSATATFTFGTSLGFTDLANSGGDRILDAWVRITANDGTKVIPHTGIDSITWSSTTLTITRTTGGAFDAAGYNDASVELFLLLSL